MWILFVVIIIVAILDLRKLPIKERKKEVVIYFIMCIITVSLGVYYTSPNYLTLAEFVLKVIP